MVLDNELQKLTLLALIQAASFTGKDLDTVYELKNAIKEAEIKEEE